MVLAKSKESGVEPDISHHCLGEHTVHLEREIIELRKSKTKPELEKCNTETKIKKWKYVKATDKSGGLFIFKSLTMISKNIHLDGTATGILVR